MVVKGLFGSFAAFFRPYVRNLNRGKQNYAVYIANIVIPAQSGGGNGFLAVHLAQSKRSDLSIWTKARAAFAYMLRKPHNFLKHKTVLVRLPTWIRNKFQNIGQNIDFMGIPARQFRLNSSTL